MKSAIITGTGIYAIPGFDLEKKQIDTSFGPALVNIARRDDFELIYLARHGLDHSTPPHNINYRANMKALQMLGVERVLATYAVGSISRDIPPMAMTVLTDFLDFTSGRPLSFFEGGKTGLAHIDLNEPYCPVLRNKLLTLAPDFDLDLHPEAVYACTNGPRLETPAEIRMYGMLGGDVIGMTGVPEVVLARELNMHFAAVAYSINWAAGLEAEMSFVGDKMGDLSNRLAALLIKTLQEQDEFDCGCENTVSFFHPPEE
jgi:purine nucleoside phosphorylase